MVYGTKLISVFVLYSLVIIYTPSIHQTHNTQTTNTQTTYKQTSEKSFQEVLSSSC